MSKYFFLLEICNLYKSIRQSSYLGFWTEKHMRLSKCKKTICALGIGLKVEFNDDRCNTENI